MSVITANGTVVATPPTATDGAFPSSQTNIPFTLNTGSQPKPAPAQTGSPIRLLNSPSAFSTLSGVGSNDTVPKCDTLYLRTSVPMLIRLTFQDSTTPVLDIKGVMLLEFDPSNMVVLIEAKGSGQIEWFASGQAA